MDYQAKKLIDDPTGGETDSKVDEDETDSSSAEDAPDPDPSTVYVCRICNIRQSYPTELFHIGDTSVSGDPHTGLRHMFRILQTPVGKQISCSNCLGLLGSAIEVPESPDVFIVPTEKLLLWKGDHFIDANTKEPIVGNGLDMVHYELDRNSYQCFQCHTQLCLGPELINRFPELPEFGIFVKVDNVHTGAIFSQKNHTRAPVYCSFCYTMLGHEIVSMGASNDFLEKGRVLLNMGCVLYRGEAHTQCAFTQKPYDPPNA